MIGRACVLFATLLLSACATPAAQRAEPSSIRLVDLTDEFARFWESSRDMDEPARVAAFKAEFATAIPGFYDHKRAGVDQARYDALIRSAFDAWPEQRASVAEVSRRFGTLLEPARRSFEAEFGRFERPQTIWLLHSLGEMDGGTRSLPGGEYLIFGADVIARIHLAHDITPFFHHELFHVLQGQGFGDCDRIWCGVWSEGLATYVAARMNPGASDAELLLTMPEPIRTQVDANRREAVCAVIARLDSTAGEDWQALFSFKRLNPHLPPRFGYYVGYLALTAAAGDRPLKELAKMPQAEARALLEAGLRKLATC